MPRKASARKTAATAKREETAVERIARKNADPAHKAASEETARLNAASQTVGKEVRETKKIPAEVKARTPDELLADARKIQASQGPDGHPKSDVKAEKPDYSEATVSAPKGEKITRLKGEAPKPYTGPVVQQGGGGAAVMPSGEPIR